MLLVVYNIFVLLCFLSGEQENIDKFSKRLVKVTKQHNEECKRLLTLMGVPYIEVQKMSPFDAFLDIYYYSQCDILVLV